MKPARPPLRPSLLMAGAGQRVAAATLILALLWLAVGWALGLPG